MKTITIHQPWATLIALGEKKFETRSWATNYRGELAIHAGKKIDKKICQTEPFRTILAMYGYHVDNLPTGTIVAICRLEACYSVLRTPNEKALLENGTLNTLHRYPIEKQEMAFGDYTDGRFAWELGDVRRLPNPVPAKGRQGFWNWEPSS
ncbi:ASCH domain-containing protein [Fontibacillus phaseoli]|uniref:ASCH domain-containing protein n=1 Tax=Fontibacillus phaseoli TaxID=1416533 RepID=A0A369BMU8_9BACL|nr:ASCH domain-containing protein [Fontibacillus phaseoli]RCX22873.1 ASCH domain-containing protein [Fontibacillus phaseoli]